MLLSGTFFVLQTMGVIKPNDEEEVNMGNMNIVSGNLGYPRIGGQREWKKQIEAYWAGKIAELELHDRLMEIRLGHLRLQRDRGLT